MKCATQLDPSEKAPSATRRIAARRLTSFSLDKLRTELAPTQRGLPGTLGEASSTMYAQGSYGREPEGRLDGCRLSSPRHQGIHAA